MDISRKILGKSLFRKIMKLSFYGHFVAGEDEKEIQPKIMQMRKYGVKSILDFSVEKDVLEAEAVSKVEKSLVEVIQKPVERPEAATKKYQISVRFADRTQKVLGARTYFYESERQCDQNMETFIHCIDAASNSKRNEGFTAIKLTALGRPQLLTGKMEQLVPTLTPDGIEQMRNMLQRVDNIASHAKSVGVRVMVDAEQSYFQPAIRRLTLEMMRLFNRDSVVIFNTYQCYLKESRCHLIQDLKHSGAENFYFGAKLVRGAYVDQERTRAEFLGYEDPICPSYEATTEMYESCVEEVFRAIKQTEIGRIAVMMATHNENTIRHALNKMREYDVTPEQKLICFGQLYGMCDYLSFALSQAGYSVYKYVPYGPVDEVLPYLSRRALENGSIFANTKRERELMIRELKRRFTNGIFWYKP